MNQDQQLCEALIDPVDGENRAVRCFLMFYTGGSAMVADVRENMRAAGFPYWPEWVEKEEAGALSKLGAQNWLRHLFALEARTATQQAAPEYMHPITILTKEVKPEHWEPQQAEPSQGVGERIDIQFDSKFSNMLQAAWVDGWGACRDSEFIGSEAMQDSFNRCNTLALCIAIDQSDDAALTATQQAAPSQGAGELPPSEILRIFVENGTHSEDGDNAGYMRIREADALKIGRALIAALLSAKPEPAGEREALVTKLMNYWINGMPSESRDVLRQAAALLAADAQRPALKPLTDEQKRAMWHGAHSVHSSWSAYEWYAQGVEDSEAAHGIKEQA